MENNIKYLYCKADVIAPKIPGTVCALKGKIYKIVRDLQFTPHILISGYFKNHNNIIEYHGQVTLSNPYLITHFIPLKYHSKLTKRLY